MPDPEVTPEQVEATIQSRRFIVLMLVAAIAGVVVVLGVDLLEWLRNLLVRLPSVT